MNEYNYPPRILLTIIQVERSDECCYFSLKVSGLRREKFLIISLSPCDSMRLQSSQVCPSVSVCFIVVLVCIFISLFLSSD